MKLVTYLSKNVERVGVLQSDTVIDLHEANQNYGLSENKAYFTDMKSLLGNIKEARPIMEKLLSHSGLPTLKLSDVKLLPPVPRPEKAMITGPSWKAYVKDGKVPDFIFVIKPQTTIRGQDDAVIFPRDPQMIVTEVELAIVVGKPGRYISKTDAWDHIAGFTIFNDVTDMGLYLERTPRAVVRAKSYDTFAPFGPCITLKEDMGDLTDINLKLRLNGEEKVNVNTGEMLYPISHFLSSVSEVMTLKVGDIISTGCPVWVPVKPGDKVEAEVDGIGTLRNHFVDHT